MNNHNTSIPTADQISSSGSPSRQADPQGPVPALSPPEGGRSPARPSTSAAAGGSKTATYSPDDNKLRLYVVHRLDAETYARVKAAGFKWAPKQDLFVAPMWTPAREDLLIELAGEIDDEDTALVDRAEQRAERFEGYSERRAADAEGARQTVEQVSQRFEFGQPILIGHHSERRARKDAERMENGMRKAVKMWQTSTYWTQRAAGAIAAAKYKELPAVRARRIKTIAADKRKQEREIIECERKGKAWANLIDADSVTRKDGEPTTFRERVLYIARHGIGCRYGLDQDIEAGKLTPEDAQASVVAGLADRKAHCERWVAHLDNRLAYERAMLAETGGLAADRFDLQVGGQVLRRHGKWLFIKKVNRKDGVVTSVSVLGHFAATIGVDEIEDYRPPAEGVAEKVKAANDKGPMCNYPGPGFVAMTQAEWKALPRWTDCSYSTTHKATETAGRHRTRSKPSGGSTWTHVNVYLTDAKRVDPPAVAPAVQLPELPAAPPRLLGETSRETPAPKLDAAPFAALREALKTGVKVVVAPQLFPTPAPLAARMVQLADIRSSQRVLEPSAGTGSILRAILEDVPGAPVIVAVEINPELARAIPTPDLADVVIAGDFLADPDMLVDSNLGTFDRILMNPPFTGGQDIAHIKHALTKLRPGGRLVALCAAGHRPGARAAPARCEGRWRLGTASGRHLREPGDIGPGIGSSSSPLSAVRFTQLFR